MDRLTLKVHQHIFNTVTLAKPMSCVVIQKYNHSFLLTVNTYKKKTKQKNIYDKDDRKYSLILR